MEAILTTLGFTALTVVLAAFHVRRSHGGDGTGSDGVSCRACPRCGARVPGEATACAACGVPMQLYEVVTAPVAPAVEPASGAGERKHAVVRADRCVGCGTCVAACPEPGALVLKGKLAVVDLDLCKELGECVRACPVGAIGLGEGAAVQRVEVPEVDAGFQTGVPGVYIVGELGGRGLIKNAINEGRVAVEAVAGELRAEGTNDDADLFDLAIVGSGPAGLSAGLEAHRAGLRYVILEQGTPADTIRKYPRKKLLLAEPVHVPLYGDLWVADASKEALLAMWETIIANTGLHLETDRRVENVVREGESLRIVTPRGDVRARRVVLAMGRRGTPRRLGVPGEESERVYYDVVEMDAFQGCRVLVVGGGDSAVESALGLANQEGATVHLSYRGDDFSRVKERNRAKLDEAVAAGRLHLLLRSQVAAIRDGAVSLTIEGAPVELPNDYVIVRVGGEPPTAFLTRIGVRMIQKDVPLAGA